MGIFVVIVLRRERHAWAHRVRPVCAAFSIGPVFHVLRGEPEKLCAYLAEVWPRAVSIYCACLFVGVPELFFSWDELPFLGRGLALLCNVLFLCAEVLLDPLLEHGICSVAGTDFFPPAALARFSLAVVGPHMV